MPNTLVSPCVILRLNPFHISFEEHFTSWSLVISKPSQVVYQFMMPMVLIACVFFVPFLLLQILTFSHLVLKERAKELAETVGADAVTLADLDNFHPEENMILANTTSIGMQPKVEETPISKVCGPLCS